MDSQARSAYIIAQAAILNAYIAMMQAANSQYPENQPYDEQAFKELIANFSGLEHNSVVSFLRD